MMQGTGTVLVTGGAKRIGRAIVEDLAAHGFSVAIHCNKSLDAARELASSINDQGGRAIAVSADLTDMVATTGLIGRVQDEFGPVSLLVNNASVFEADSALDLDWAGWDDHFAIHVKAPVILTQTFAKALPADQHGLVVNIVDQRVWRPSPRFFSYTLSKSTLWSATQTMAQALAPLIRVNAIGPGPTFKSKRQSDQDFLNQTEGLLLRQGPELDEFGATIRYLWQARSVTGQMIALDGGQHLAWETPDVIGIGE